jgi:beta-phosphoglucomutase
MRFQSFVFDLDGVLVNTNSIHEKAFADLWNQIGIQGPRYEQIAGQKTEDVIREYTCDLKQSEKDLIRWIRFKQEQARNYASAQSILYEDAIETLETIRVWKLPVALGTGSSRITTDLILKRFHLSDYFKAVITADEITRGKPEPDTYIEAMSRAGMLPSETLIIEDSNSGILSALTSGASVASVRTGKTSTHEGFIGSFENLRALFQKLSTT